MLKHMGRENFRNCGETLKRYWEEQSYEAVAQPSMCMQDRKQADFAISMKNIAGEWGWGQSIFVLFPHLASKHLSSSYLV